MIKKANKKIVRKLFTKDEIRNLKAHSKASTPVLKIAKLLKRSEGSLRQKALKLVSDSGIGGSHEKEQLPQS